MKYFVILEQSQEARSLATFLKNILYKNLFKHFERLNTVFAKTFQRKVCNFQLSKDKCIKMREYTLTLDSITETILITSSSLNQNSSLVKVV